MDSDSALDWASVHQAMGLVLDLVSVLVLGCQLASDSASAQDSESGSPQGWAMEFAQASRSGLRLVFPLPSVWFA